MVTFNIPPFVGNEIDYVKDAAAVNHKICGDGPYSERCHRWLEERFGAKKALLTTSCTSALEMAAILCDFAPGEEVILPSYTFSSTATAFQMAGAKLVFVDIRPDTMNIDEKRIEEAITPKTRAIVPVHYAGVSCEMDTINDIAARYDLKVIEDAAQGVMSTYKGRALGTLGTFGCYSFHETKNYSMGEGGALLINDDAFIERAEIIREKGTNRKRFFRGQVDKYTWVDRGGSYLQSDLNAAYLYAQLEQAELINEDRLATWAAYDSALKPLEAEGLLELPFIPEECTHNAHMYYVKLADLAQRESFTQHMKDNEVYCVFHYIPLHSSPAGERFGRFSGEDVHTTRESNRLVRLPMYYGMTDQDRQKVIDAAISFFRR